MTNDPFPATEAPRIMPGNTLNANQSRCRVAILLGTYQGEDYLSEQLDSFEKQTHSNWRVYVSDDGSRDGTLSILETYQRTWSKERLSIYSGPKSGFAANFMSLIDNSDCQADYFAFSDQDDIWEEKKLERALQWLEDIPSDTPALYCSRTKLVDKHNREIKLSTLFSKKPTFSNALIQSLGGGNTMVLNKAARELLCGTRGHMPDISHDWWAYMVVSGCGGYVFYDAVPNVRYRQHEHNLMGTNLGLQGRFMRIRMLRQGYFRRWNDRSIAALRVMNNKLTPGSRNILGLFARARRKSLIPRLIGLRRSGIYRQTLLGNLGLLVAAVFGKM